MIKNINIIKAKFRRNKKNFFKTDLYENLDKKLQHEICISVLLLQNEIPLLGYFDNKSDYWLLTNCRIISNDFTIFLNEIQVINIPEIFHEGKGNSECESLEVVDKRSSKYILKLEKLTWYVIFNILNFIIRHQI